MQVVTNVTLLHDCKQPTELAKVDIMNSLGYQL